MVSSVLFAFLFLPGKEALPQLAANLLVEFLVALPLWVACASLYLCLKLLFASDLVAVFVLFLYQFLLWPILGPGPSWTQGLGDEAAVYLAPDDPLLGQGRGHHVRLIWVSRCL